MMYCIALIGDIRSSRDLDDRGKVQRSLQECLTDLNKQYNDVLISPLTITLGDEFQALLGCAEEIWKIIFKIECQMYPTRIRFGIGIGNISTDINTKSAIGMDGPAFYSARHAMQEIKKSEDCYKIKGLEKDEELTNNMLTLISDNKIKWEENRIKIFHDLLEHKKVNAIALNIGISQTAVYKNISDGSLKVIGKIMQAFSEKINQQIGR
ncbi:MAG: hypothetical protein DRR42_08810 [Gammaproteobacteria bacterium]|nr:MAG: hypothetical protein DRR42_08810 [Gammaproteobacteria bacterium]